MEMRLDATTLRWIRDGLPIDEVVRTRYHMIRDGNLLIVQPRPYAFDVSRHFGFDEMYPDTTLLMDLGRSPDIP